MKRSFQLSALGYKLILGTISALFLILSFPNFNFELLAWVALVPLFFAIENQKPLKTFLACYLAGALFFLGTIWWLVHVTLPGMIVVVLYLALYFGLFGAIVSYIVHRTSCIVQLFLIPASWVACEWLRSTLLTGFGWALLGYSQSYSLPVIQIADIFGAYGISYLVVMVNFTIYLVIKAFPNRRAFFIPLTIATFLVFTTLAYGYFRLNNIFAGERLRVAVIQGNIPQKNKWNPDFREEILYKYESLTRKAAREGADLIVWPEASVPGFLERDLLDRVRSLARDVKTPLLVGAPMEEKGGAYYNSAVLFSGDGALIERYDKIHLVPFGEYIPLKRIFHFAEKFAPLPIGDFSRGGSYTVFKFPVERNLKAKDGNWRLVKKVSFSCLVCFEDIFGDLVRRFVKNGAHFLINITNDAWFGKTAAAYQHAQASVLRAVENRTSVVRAANTGLSCFIDQKGRITDSVEVEGEELFVDGFRIRDITLARTRTFYTVYGDVFVYLCVFFTLAFLLRTKRPRPI